MAKGEYGPAIENAMGILVALGDIFEAERLVDIKSVHMPGSSVVVSGDAGLQFVEETCKTGAQFRVMVTLNTGAVDFRLWKQLGLPEEVVEKQFRLTKAYQDMGAIPLHSCCPYLCGNTPRPNEQVAWGESSAVVFANSVLGARANREGGPSALASAITGKSPMYGYRLDRNRRSTHVIRIDADLKSITDYGALGYCVGKIVKDGVPLFIGMRDPSVDELKMLGAALASSGAVALFHVDGVTPEADSISRYLKEDKPQEIEIGQKQVDEAYHLLSKAMEKPVDVVCVGCPHCSIQEIAEAARLLKGKRVDSHVAFWICTSSPVKALADRMGLSQAIEEAGALLVQDTCPVLAPMKEVAPKLGYRTVATNSAKLANYAPGQCKLMPHFGTLEDCLNSAISGMWREE